MGTEMDFIDRYAKWIKDNSKQRPINGFTEISTPFLDSHNDCIQFYIQHEGNGYTLTDDGYTISDLIMNGIDFSNPKRRELLNSIAFSMNVSIQDDEIISKANNEYQLTQAMHFMIQAMIKISDMFYVSSHRIKGMFFDDVRTYFLDHDIRCTPSVMFSGKSGLTHRFDFVIPASKAEPERMITTLNQPSKQNIGSTLFAWNDVRTTRHDSKGYIILNGSRKKNQSLIDAAGQYDMRAFCWDDRDEYLNELAS